MPAERDEPIGERLQGQVHVLGKDVSLLIVVMDLTLSFAAWLVRRGRSELHAVQCQHLSAGCQQDRLHQLHGGLRSLRLN